MKRTTIDIVFEGDTDYDKIDNVIDRVEHIKTIYFRYYIVTKELYNTELKSCVNVGDRLQWIPHARFNSSEMMKSGAHHVIEFKIARIDVEEMMKVIFDVIYQQNNSNRCTYYTKRAEDVKTVDYSLWHRFVCDVFLYTYLYIHLISYPLRYITKRNSDELINASLKENIDYFVYNSRERSKLPYKLGCLYEMIRKCLNMDCSSVKNLVSNKEVLQYTKLTLRNWVVCFMYVGLCLWFVLFWLFGFRSGLYNIWLFIVFNYISNLYLFYKMIRYSGFSIQSIFSSRPISVALLYVLISHYSIFILPCFMVAFFLRCYISAIFEKNIYYKNILLEKVCYY